MKTKHLLSLALFAVISVLSINTVSAQLFRYGIKGGLDVASPKVSTDVFDVKNRVGFRIGGVVELKVPLTGFGVESGVYYGNRGFDVKDSKTGVSGDISNMNYVSVPILLKQRFSLLGVAGIYISGGVFGNARISGGDLTIDGVEYKPKKLQKGLDFGAGVSVLSHLDVGVNYRYRFGDAYDYDSLDKNFKKIGRNTWTISVGYLF